jgi:hypothetical protein
MGGDDEQLSSSRIPLLFPYYSIQFPCSAILIPLFYRVGEFADGRLIFNHLRALTSEPRAVFGGIFS